MFSKRDTKMARYRDYETRFFREQNEIIFGDQGQPDLISQMKEIYTHLQLDPFYYEMKKEVD